MNFSLTVISQFMIALAVVMFLLGYYLGKRKTENPLTTALIAGASAMVPPVALIILITLVMKKDITSA